MLKKLKEMCLSLGIFSLLAVPVLVPAVAFADLEHYRYANSVCGGTNANVRDDAGAAGDCADQQKVKVSRLSFAKSSRSSRSSSVSWPWS